MRVIAGSARRLQLKTPDGMDTRPTQDRIKETLFNMIQNEVVGCRFLDLFSGSGGIGIEALSRGAREAVFVETGKNALKVIKENIAHTGFDQQAEVMAMDAVSSVRMLSSRGVFHVIYMDPPYGKGLEMEVLSALTHSDIIDEDTLIIIEADLKTELAGLEELGFTMVRNKTYKTNQHFFVKRG